MVTTSHYIFLESQVGHVEWARMLSKFQNLSGVNRKLFVVQSKATIGFTTHRSSEGLFCLAEEEPSVKPGAILKWADCISILIRIQVRFQR